MPDAFSPMSKGRSAVENITFKNLGCCSNAEKAKAALGDALATYLLRPELRRQVGLSKPSVPDRLGSVLGLFVLKSQIGDALADAFSLPLCWRKSVHDSPRLPDGFSQVAESVRRVTGINNWGLGLSEELADYDLSEIAIDASSLWAPLAAGLLLATKGGTPEPYVFATGAWTEDGGMTKVGDVEKKIKVCFDLAGASGKKPTIFVPAANFDEIREQCSGKAELFDYEPGTTKWHRVMQTHLAHLHVPPAKQDDLSVRVAYANQLYIVRDRKRRQEYYLNNLVDDLAVRVKDRAGVCPWTRPVERLALGLSFNYEVCLLVIKALNPQSALIFVTKETEKFKDNVREALYNTRTELKFEKFEEQNEPDCLKLCTDYFKEASTKECIVEITGGTKVMSLMLAAAGQKTGAYILYLQHEYSNNAPVFDSEKLRALDWLSLK